MFEKTPEEILRGWAKAYRDTPEHRFPSDPHAEFFPVDLEASADEIERLRKALEEIAGLDRHYYIDSTKKYDGHLAKIARKALAGVVGDAR
jgi:hypothetical protein